MFKLALEDVWMVDVIILVVMTDTAQMKAIETKTNFKIKSVLTSD